MEEIPVYVKAELGQASLPESEEVEEKAAEEAEDGGTALFPAEEGQNLPAAVESPTVEVVRSGQLQVDVEGTVCPRRYPRQ